MIWFSVFCISVACLANTVSCLMILNLFLKGKKYLAVTMLELFNYWWAERERLKREEKKENDNIDELLGGYKL